VKKLYLNIDKQKSNRNLNIFLAVINKTAGRGVNKQ